MEGAEAGGAERFPDRVTDVAEFTALIVPANGLVADPPAPWLMMMSLPTSPAGAAALTKLAPASVNVAVPEVPVPPVPIFPSPSAPYCWTGNCHGGYCNAARTPAVTTCTTVNPAACAAVADPSAPRTTVHTGPATLMTVIISDASAGSATWNC